jgi:hypothetical protein
VGDARHIDAAAAGIAQRNLRVDSTRSTLTKMSTAGLMVRVTISGTLPLPAKVSRYEENKFIF